LGTIQAVYKRSQNPQKRARKGRHGGGVGIYEFLFLKLIFALIDF